MIRLGGVADTATIAAAYSRMGYAGGISPDDTAWLAEMAGEWIGVVRVAPEHGVLVLRGMRIVERWQRRGIGTRMLAEVGSWLGSRPCYCIPHSHLAGFYGQIGFVEIAPAAAPAFLSSRYAGYKHRALDVLIMLRGARVS